MNLFRIEQLPLLVCLLTFNLFQEATGATVTREIMLNGRPHSIMGTTLDIGGVAVDYFAKIPYAQPPVEKLRFKPPQSIVGDFWTGLYNSTVQPNTCWQVSGGVFDLQNAGAKLWLSKTTMSEDCLYLTIWVPKTLTGILPVMVWIYGGGFSSGSSTLEVYDGSFLAARKNVIVVSLQYRLGPLGFLYLNDNLAPGNQGLLDQRMALSWVKNNIATFNGDNSKITIFGESAGSASVSFHVLSPSSQILFNRAIMESGSFLSPWALDSKSDAKEKAIELISYLNCTANRSDLHGLFLCAMGADPASLVNLQFNLASFTATQRMRLLKKRGDPRISSDASYFIAIFFKPVYDDLFIPLNIYRHPGALSVKPGMELMMGFNANEGMYFLLYGLNSTLNFLQGGTIVQTTCLASNSSNPISASTLILENIASAEYEYPSLMPLLSYEYGVPSAFMGGQTWTDLDVLSALDQMTADELFVCPVVNLASMIAQKNPNVYMYQFSHKTAAVPFPEWVGTMHGYEIEYVFGMPFSDTFKSLYYGFSSEETTLSDSMMTFWANFVKFGNPTPTPVKFFGNTASWLPYNSSGSLLFQLSTPQESVAYPVQVTNKTTKCNFWKQVMPSIARGYTEDVRTSSAVRKASWFGTLFLWILVIGGSVTN